MMRWQSLVGIAAVVATLVIGSGCSTVPVTGRSQLSLVSDAEMATMATSEYRKTLKEAELSQNKAQVAMVQRVGQRIAAAVDAYAKTHNMTNQFNWEFNLIQDDKQVNAWAMPGGKVAFYTGIMPICQDENGVAVVMGHEIAHALARHGSERMSQALAAQIGNVALSAALRDQPAQTRQMWSMAAGVGTQVGVMLPFSRLHESEADHIGMILMAMAGYDPGHAVPFWQRMAQAGGAKPPEFLSTHPGNARRIADIKAKLPSIRAKYYRP